MLYFLNNQTMAATSFKLFVLFHCPWLASRFFVSRPFEEIASSTTCNLEFPTIFTALVQRASAWARMRVAFCANC